MDIFRKKIVPILLSTIWISINEFLRNQFLMKQIWIEHYQKLGLTFPEQPINGAIWGIWATCFSVITFIISKKFTRFDSIIILWICGFVLMWLVIGNLLVLPFNILPLAIPLSIIEVIGAVLIVKHKFFN